MKTLLRFVLFLTIFSINSFVSEAQSWAPIGATWYYEVVSAFSPLSDYVMYQSVGDSIIDGKNCKVIIIKKGAQYGIIPNSDTAYTYENNGKVFVYNNKKKAFGLIYDFSLNTGDTFKANWDTCNYPIKIRDTGSIMINGRSLKTLNGEVGFQIIQWIGGSHSLFNDFISLLECKKDSLVIEAPWVQGLRCYSDSIIGYYNTGLASTCDYFHSSINEDKIYKDILIYPNPATNQLFVNISGTNHSTNAVLIDITGRELMKKTLQTGENEIQLNENLSGIYFLKILDKQNQVLVVKKVLVE